MPNPQGYIGSVIYQERFRVPAWWWLIALVMVATAAVAVLAYVPPMPGWIVVGLFGAATGLLVFSYGRTAIQISDGVLKVGRNTIDGKWIGSVERLDRQASRHALSAGADVTDLLLIRPYIAELVRVGIADRADPHAHWIISSRHAAELADVIADLTKQSS